MKRRRLFLLNDQTAPRINTELACEIGLNESIILLQFEFWQSISEHFYEDKYWFYNSIPEIRDTFRFWSVETVKRSVAELIRRNYVYTGNFNKSKFDKRRWYSLNFNELSKLNSIRIDMNHDQVNLTQSKESAIISDKVNLTSSEGSICPHPEEQFDPILKVNLTPSSIQRDQQRDQQTDRQTSKKQSQSVSQSVSSDSKSDSKSKALLSICKVQNKSVLTLIKSALMQHGKEYVLNQIWYCNAKCKDLRAYRKLLSDSITGDYGAAWKDDALFSAEVSGKEKASLKAREAVNNAERMLYNQVKSNVTKNVDKVKLYIDSISKDDLEKIKSEFAEKVVNSLTSVNGYKFFDGMKQLSISERRLEFKKFGFESRIIKSTFNKFILNEYLKGKEHEQTSV